MLVDQNAHLLVARPGVAKVACQRGDATVHLGYRDRFVIEPLDRGEERRTVPGSTAVTGEASLRSRHECVTKPCLFRPE